MSHFIWRLSSDYNEKQNESDFVKVVHGGKVPPATAFWLGGAHRVSAKGSFLACCLRNKKICRIAKRNVDWTWHDDIDARNLWEGLDDLKKRSDPSWLAAVGIGIEAFWDLYGDKLMDTDFRVKIHWNDSGKPEPLKVRKPW